MIKTSLIGYEALLEHMESWSVDRAYANVAEFTESEIDKGLRKGWINSDLHADWHSLSEQDQMYIIYKVNLQCGFDTPV